MRGRAHVERAAQPVFVDEPGASTAPSRPCSAIRRSTSGRAGPSPRISPELRHALASTRDRRHECSRLLLGDVAPHEDDHRLGGLRRRAGRACINALEHRHIAAHALLPKPSGEQPREAESLVPYADAAALHRESDAPTDRSQVFAPVLARPDLEPIDDDPKRMSSPGQRRREQREVGERSGMDDVVARACAGEMGEDAQAEAKRRHDPPPSACGVEVEPGPDRNDLDSGHLDDLALGPVTQRQVSDAMPLRGETLGKVAVPALGPPIVYGENRS